jgi:hypothetical protein
MVDARCPVVVGRDAEIAVLRGVLAAAREGRGGLAVLTGMPGVGKSRLLTDLVGSARHDGWIVATGRAISGHAATPYRPLAEALLPMTRELDVRRVEGLGPWRAGLRAVFADPFEGKVQPRADPLVCGEAIVRLLRAVTAAGPVLVGLEDLHWADPDTLAVVDYLADHLAETAAACVVTVRSQPHSAAVDLIHILSARRNIAHVALAPLDDAAVVAMVRACRPAAAADTVGAVVASAEGIPFLVEELLSAPGLPPSFTSSVAARLGELTPAERDVRSGGGRATFRLAAGGRRVRAGRGPGGGSTGSGTATAVGRRRRGPVQLPSRADPRRCARWVAAPLPPPRRPRLPGRIGDHPSGTSRRAAGAGGRSCRAGRDGRARSRPAG